MNAYIKFPLMEVQKYAALDAWFARYDDWKLRRDYPNNYHDDLLRQADEMDRLRLIGFVEWRELRVLADQAFLRSVEGGDFPVHRSPTRHSVLSLQHRCHSTEI